MFIKRCYSTLNRKAKIHYQLVHSYYDNGTSRHRVIANLGSLSEKEINSLIKSLNRLKSQPFTLAQARLAHKQIYVYGSAFVLRELWKRLEIDQVFSRALRRFKMKFDACGIALMLAINRCLDPMSKLSFSRWQRKVYVQAIPRYDYEDILRCLHYLSQVKDEVEAELFERQKTLFHLTVDVVLYDVTSIYYEGDGPSMAVFGYSRDHRSDTHQVLLAIATTKDGLPIGHEVFAGNVQDKITVPTILDKLKKRFTIDKCIFVGDRGMVSEVNYLLLKEKGYQFIFALRRRRLEETREVLEPDLKRYETILEKDGQGEIKKDEQGNPIVKLYYLGIQKEGFHYVLGHNPKVCAQQLQKIQERRAALDEKIKNILLRYKTPEVILKKITRLRYVDRYFKYHLVQGKVQVEANTQSLAYEELIAGKYILKSDAPGLSTEEILNAYRNLAEVEESFRNMKSFLDIRPMWHRKESHMRGHIFVCVLAHRLMKTVEYYLKGGDLLKHLEEEGLSPARALEEFSEIVMVESDLNGTKVLSATQLAKKHKELLKRMEINHIPLEAPAPPV